jgi:Zn ribbon nucleic-acid-binding protein
MIRRWLKPCPRCRGNQLLELHEESRHVVRCMDCGYLLLTTETRFLTEDMVFGRRATADRIMEHA